MSIPEFSSDPRLRAEAKPQLRQYIRRYDDVHLLETAFNHWEIVGKFKVLSDYAIAAAAEAFDKSDFEACAEAAELFEGSRKTIRFSQLIARVAETEITSRRQREAVKKRSSTEAS